MVSKAVITRQPRCYTHHHSARGCGHHTSASAAPWTAPARKATGNRYNCTRRGPPGVFWLQPPITCTVHIALMLLSAAWVVLRAPCPQPHSEPAPSKLHGTSPLYPSTFSTLHSQPSPVQPG